MINTTPFGTTIAQTLNYIGDYQDGQASVKVRIPILCDHQRQNTCALSPAGWHTMADFPLSVSFSTTS